jgi:hypothetical protein
LARFVASSSNASPRLQYRSTIAEQASDERDGCDDQKAVEEQLGDAGSGTGDPTEAQEGCYEGDNEKYDCVSQHGVFLSLLNGCSR